jgi:hypothetical protein
MVRICIAHMAVMRNAYTQSFISLERPRHRWDDNIKMYIKENGMTVLNR